MRSKGLAHFDLLATRFLSGENTRREGQRLMALLKVKEWAGRFTVIKSHWAAAKSPPIGGFDATAAGQRLAAKIIEETKARKKTKHRPKASPVRQHPKLLKTSAALKRSARPKSHKERSPK